MTSPAQSAHIPFSLWPALLAYGAADPRWAQVRALPPASWAQIVASAQMHNMAAQLALQLRSQSWRPDLAPAAENVLQTALRLAAMQSLARRYELHQALVTLAAAAVTPVVVKGALLANTVYADPAARPMGDIDLWVTAEEMPQAWRALEGDGYTQRSKDSRPLEFQAQHDGEVQLVSQAPGRGLIELHWGVFAGEWLRWVAPVDRTGLRQRVRPVMLLGQPAYALAPEDHLIQVAVHVAINHQFTFSVLRSLLDLVMMARAGVEWPVVVARAQAWRVATAVGYALKLAAELYDEPALAAPAAQMLPLRQEQNLPRYVSAQSIMAGEQLAASRRRLVFLLNATDRRRDAVRLVVRTLWPDDDWLAALYGRRGAAVRWRHMRSALQGNI